MERSGGHGPALVHTIGKPDPMAWDGGYRDGPAGEAQFNQPNCVAPEASGSILVVDRNHCVRRVSADGRHVTTVAGVPLKKGYRDGVAGEAQFNQPNCVAPEASGSMLVADSGNHCVRRVSADGRHVTTVAGMPRWKGYRDGPAGEAQFNQPKCVALEASGSMLVADSGNHCVRRVSADGRHVTTVAGVLRKEGHRDGAAWEALFNCPVWVALEASGSILVADYSNNCVRRVSADGRHVTTVAGVPLKEGYRDGVAGEALFKHPVCVAPEASGSMLVADSSNDCVRRVSADGRHVTTVEVQLIYPVCVALGASGSMLVAELLNQCVRVVKGLGLTPPAERLLEPEPEPPRIPEDVTPAPSPLQQLCAMGHAREEARAALAAYDDDLAQAGAALLQAALHRKQQEQQEQLQEQQATMEDALRQEKARADAAVAAVKRQEQVVAAAAAARAESEAILATAGPHMLHASDGSAEPEPEESEADPYVRELSVLRVKALKQRAKVLGATTANIEDIDDAEDTKGAAVALVTSLKADLSSLRVKELKRLLRAAGVAAATVDDVDDTDDPKATAIEMLLQASAGVAPEGPASAVAFGTVKEAAAQAIIESHGQRAQVMEPSDEFDFVFSNRTASDALCLRIRAELTARGLRVWQQKTNIPKDSDNWFDEWFPSAMKSRKIVCFLTVEYLKSPYCMKEFGIALASHKLLVVACDPLAHIRAVDSSVYPYASNALAYLMGGGQVIFNGTEDVVVEIVKFAQ